MQKASSLLKFNLNIPNKRTRAAACGSPFAVLLAVAAAGKNEESDYNDPNDVAVIKKVAKAVVHKYFLLEIV